MAVRVRAPDDLPQSSPLPFDKCDVTSVKSAKELRTNTTIPRLELRHISFLMELKALTQKCLILGICSADPDLPFDTVLSNQQICTG